MFVDVFPSVKLSQDFVNVSSNRWVKNFLSYYNAVWIDDEPTSSCKACFLNVDAVLSCSLSCWVCCKEELNILHKRLNFAEYLVAENGVRRNGDYLSPTGFNLLIFGCDRSQLCWSDESEVCRIKAHNEKLTFVVRNVVRELYCLVAVGVWVVSLEFKFGSSLSDKSHVFLLQIIFSFKISYRTSLSQLFKGLNLSIKGKGKILTAEGKRMVEFFKLKVKGEQPLIECVFTVTGSKKKAKKLINEGLCSVNRLKELFYRREVKPNSLVCVILNHLLFDEKRIEKLYEDEYVLVVNKPPFINSNKDFPNVEEVLKRKNKDYTVVHRLDKQTSGALIVAKEKKIFESFKELFRKRKVKKVYLSLVAGNFKKKSGKVNVPLDGKPSKTLFRVLEEFNGTSLLEVEIPTGRKHQIRRHLSLINHPVLGLRQSWSRKWWRNGSRYL